MGPGTTPNWFTYITSSFSHTSEIGGSQLPGDLPGGNQYDTSGERIQTYARRLFDLFGGKSPEDRFTKAVTENTGGNPVAQEVADFLTNNPDFSLENTNVNRCIDEHPPSRLSAPMRSSNSSRCSASTG